MCGICGIYNFGSIEPVTREELEKMNGLLIHRGPDDEGYFLSGNVGLAMRRLSIIDIAGGRQPISNEKGNIWVVLNGEIYNFQELKASLIKKGHKFKTKTDTEVIVHLYEENGLGFVEDLRGMFAIALWDGRKERLVLARDRIGKKPLFYSLGSDFISFASELRALLTDKRISRDINLSAVDSFLVLQYIPSPMSIFQAIKKLEPASILVLENGKAKVSKYWNLPLGRKDLRGIETEQIKEMLLTELSSATKMRMIADVPLGAFLSGGIDSSIIVALMSHFSERPVKTFSIGFKEEKFSELKYAREVANMYATNHTEFIVEAKMAEILPKLVWHYSEPYADSSALPSYYVSRETRRAVTVALNGDGGDENFGGYLRYVAMNAARIANKFPDAAKKMALEVLKSVALEKNAPYNFPWRARKFLEAIINKGIPCTYLATVSFFKTDEKNTLVSDKFKNILGKDLNYAERYITTLYNMAEEKDFLNKLLYVDFRSYLPECLMTKMDIASMANSLEARSPFLDHKFIELAFFDSRRFENQEVQ